MRKGSGGENCLVFSIRKKAAGRLLIPMDNVCSAFQKASIFIMRRGAGGENCLVFSIREWTAGRLLIPMDNVCSACLPPTRLDHIHQISPASLLRQC